MADVQLDKLKSWFQQQAEREAKKDVLTKGERWGSVCSIIAIMIFLVYFMVHVTSQTGFFTAGFGAVAAVLFFGFNAWGMIAPAVKLVKGRKSPSKPFEISGSILAFVALIYFLIAFTFDFTHLAAPLPDFLKWIVSWISDDFAKIVMTLASIVMVFIIPFQIISYKYLRIELAKPAAVPASILAPEQNQEAPKP
jgi:hypothetical protein